MNDVIESIRSTSNNNKHHALNVYMGVIESSMENPKDSSCCEKTWKIASTVIFLLHQFPFFLIKWAWLFIVLYCWEIIFFCISGVKCFIVGWRHWWRDVTSGDVSGLHLTIKSFSIDATFCCHDTDVTGATCRHHLCSGRQTSCRNVPTTGPTGLSQKN